MGTEFSDIGDLNGSIIMTEENTINIILKLLRFLCSVQSYSKKLLDILVKYNHFKLYICEGMHV